MVAFAAAMMFVGIGQLRDMPVDILPEFMPPYVAIQTEALGLSAEEVEQLITVPLEADLLNGVAWLDVIRSESVPGLSSIELLFKPGTDFMRARQMVQERLTQAHQLPKVSKAPAMLQPLSSTSRVMMIGLSSSNLSLIDMSVLARWTIRPRLMGVPGVANVAIWGQRERQLQVQVEPKRLRDHGVSLLDVIATTGNALWVSPLTFLNASTPGTGGFIEAPNQRLGIRHVSPIVRPSDLAQVPIKKGKGKALRLGDVAEVVEDHQPLIGDAIINDGPGLLLVVERFPWANTLDVTRRVDAALDGLRPGLSGLEIDSSIFRPATFIKMAIGNLRRALLLGSVLVALVLGAFLFEWRTAFISLVAIPLSLVAAALVLYLHGATVNVMVLTGLVIAVCVVVDDAIIDIENIRRRLRQPPEEGSGKSTATIVLEASLEMRRSMVYATLIILLALLPVFFMKGLSGTFFQPLAFSYALAVLGSMLVAVTVTPALGLILLSRAPVVPRDAPLVRWLQGGYETVLARIIHTPWTALLAVCVTVLVGLAVVPRLGQSLLPSFKERDLLIHWDGKPGTSLPEMKRITSQVSRELRSIPGVRNVGARLGRAVMSDQVVGINSSELWVSVDPAADYGATVASIQEVVADYPGFYRDVRTYLNERIRKVLTGTSEAVVVRIYGENLGFLRGKAEEVSYVLSGIDGIVDVHVELQVEEPTVEIEVNLVAAQRHGIKPGDVRRAAATLVSGIEVGNVFEEQKVFDVVVRGTPDTRHSLTSIGELLIDTPSGGHVRVGEVAKLRVAPNPNVIRREAVSRRIDVEANVRGRALGSVVRQVERRLKGVEFPLGYHAEVLGEYAERQAAQRRMLGYAGVAAIGIFLLLQAAFRSWRLACVAFLTLPMALVGGVLAAFAGGGIISLGSLVGFLTILGIAARNGIMLINHYQHLERHEGETFGPGLILRGARERLAPILMTALATGLAFVPLVVFGEIPGHEIVHPVAVVILGGLVTSTLLNLFIVPALYSRFASSPEPVLRAPQ
jgi:CzcA family heavy metal efflux pump